MRAVLLACGAVALVAVALACVDLITGASAVLVVAAKAGAARTEAAIRAADIVLNMAVSSWMGISKVSATMTGPIDHGSNPTEGALNPP